jgi:FkbH-like protein
MVPWFSPLGILDNKSKFGFRIFFQELNKKLLDLYVESRQVYIVDLESLSSKHGKSKSENYKLYYRGNLKLSKTFMPFVASEYVTYFKALKNLNRKCVVLDLDNVLWGGILGEDELNGIRLGGGPIGRAYVDFQKLLLAYYNRGVILAVNSKNNQEEALNVFQHHPNMILREKNFAAMKINWQDKVENMIALAEELNIGLESMIFVDDSSQERERIRQALPQVLVLDLPKSPYQYCEALQTLTDLEALFVSNEDKQRGEMYYARKKRRELMKSKASLEDFFKSLDIKLEIKYADRFSIPRVTSLINRANQFNLTTLRYNQTEVKDMSFNANQFKVYSLKVEDKFGDEGIVGVAIIRKKGKEWIIDSFLLSCRVIGRKIETVLLAKIISDAKKNGTPKVVGKYIPTKKNVPAKSFYKDHGFKLKKSKNKTLTWELRLDENIPIKIPGWVTVKYG